MKSIQTHGTRFCAWYYGFCFCSHVPKSNLRYTRGITAKGVTSITPKRVTGVTSITPKRVTVLRHRLCLAHGQRSSEEISQRWRLASRWRNCANLTGPGIEPQTSRTDGACLTTELTGRCSHAPPGEKELDCFTRKASKERFLLLVVAYGLAFYLQLACGPQGLCKTQ